MKSSARKPHYVNNKDFYEAIIAYRNVLKTNPEAKVPDYIGTCILKISEKLSTKPNFIGYSFRDEMIADAIENCIYAVPIFDPERTSNPFAYFTQIAWNAFLRRIAKEKKQQYIKHKNMQNLQMFSSPEDSMLEDNFKKVQVKENQISNEIISSFEKTLTKTKKTAKIGIVKFAEEAPKND